MHEVVVAVLVPVVAQLVQNLSNGIGMIEAFGMLGGVGLLIVAAIEAKRDRGLSALWIAIIAAIVMGSAFYVVQQAYKFGGSQVQLQQGNLQ